HGLSAARQPPLWRGELARRLDALSERGSPLLEGDDPDGRGPRCHHASLSCDLCPRHRQVPARRAWRAFCRVSGTWPRDDDDDPERLCEYVLLHPDLANSGQYCRCAAAAPLFGRAKTRLTAGRPYDLDRL